MTFYKSPEDARDNSPFELPPLVCVECEQAVTGAVVIYDLRMPATDRFTHIALHPDCALLVGQRLIVDAFESRSRR